jgi:acyl-CoA synthetase (AMP-forming)/AMP-acid ligase II
MRAELLPTVIVAYGLTETCGMVSICDPGSPAEVLSSTVGKPIPGTEVMIRAPEGEVMVRGFTVMQGYFEDETATGQAITADGWLHTGDIGTLRPDGNLRITDRLKDMYTAGGFNVYPAEVEQVIATMEEVAEVAVIGTPDYRLGEVGKAFVVPRPGHQNLDADEIIAYCRDRLAGYKVPVSVTITAELPKNAAGKVIKDVLRSG